MLEFLHSWVVFPAVLTVLALGSGLLLERASGRLIPGVLLLPLGYAGTILFAEATTFTAATAPLTSPLLVLTAIAGFVVTTRGIEVPNRAPLLVAGGVFLVYAAPMLFAGEASWAGYQRLDDTAGWMAVGEYMLREGRELSGLEPSTYSIALGLYAGTWYPIGSFLPWASASQLSGIDIAWTAQPYMAWQAGVLALTLMAIARTLISSERTVAWIAFIAAQPALLYGYALWGGMKELAGAILIALLAWCAVEVARKDRLTRDMVLVMVAGASLFFSLSFGGAVWLLPVPVLALAIVVLEGRSPVPILKALGVVMGAAVLLAVPFIASGAVGPSNLDSLRNPVDAFGNLFDELPYLQVAGIWPSGDFRLDPRVEPLTLILAAAIVALAAYCSYLAIKRRDWVPAMYGATAVGGLVPAIWFADPWIDAKAMAMCSPAFLLLALIAAVSIERKGGRNVAYLAVGVLSAGVLWSNFLAYHETTIAPESEMRELADINDLIEGEGPTLVTMSQPYAGRYFLRDATPSGAGETRKPDPVPLVDGREVPRNGSADTDEIDYPTLQGYRTLVLRRSPIQSRPPGEYELLWAGEYFEVWQRGESPATAVEHIGLGQDLKPPTPGLSLERNGEPNCRELRAAARELGPDAVIAAQPSVPSAAVGIDPEFVPSGWTVLDQGVITPDGSGELRGVVQLPEGGRFGIWARGSIRGEMSVTVDGEEVGEIYHRINNAGQYVLLGETELEAGEHKLIFEYEVSPLAPGAGGGGYDFGPVVIGQSSEAAPEEFTVSPDEVASLCGESWDWIEIRG